MASTVSAAVADSGLLVTQQWFADDAAGLTSDEVMIAFQQGRGEPLAHSVFQTGNEPQQIWVLLTAHNRNSQAASLRLVTGTPYSRLLRARLFRLGSVTDSKANETSRLLINEYESRPFSERNNHFRLLNSDSFTISAGGTAQLLIQTIVEGPSYLPFSLLTDSEFEALQLQDSVFAALFYGFTFTLGLLFLLFSLAVRHCVGLMYAGLFLLGLLVMADIDGHAFQWLWPDSPRWNQFSPMVILPLLNGLGFLIIHQLLASVDVQQFARYKTLIFSWTQSLALLFAAISLLLPVLLVILPFSSVIQLENLMSIPAFLLQPIAFTAWLHLGRRNYVSLLAVLVVNITMAGLVLLVFIDIPLPDLLIKHVHHAAYLIVGLMVMSIWGCIKISS